MTDPRLADSPITPISQMPTPILTDDQHRFFLENGYILIPNAIPHETIAAAIAFLEGGTYAGSVGAVDYRSPHGTPTEACVTDQVLQIIGELFGAEYPFDGHRGASNMPRPYEPEKAYQPQGFHVDDDYPTLMPAGWALGMFLFLTPVRSHGGAFNFAPGSYLRYRAAGRDNPETLIYLTKEPHLSGEIQELLAQPGDLLLFHHLMGHAGSNNVTDPQTRHALLNRYHPHRRIVPGMKPFTEMTTIEKANSSRYLAEQHLGTDGLPLIPPDSAADSAIGKGIGSGTMTAQLGGLIDGKPYLLYVSREQPETVQVAISQDFVSWNAIAPLPLPAAPCGAIEHLNMYRRGQDWLHFIGGGNSTRLYTCADDNSLRLIADLPGCRFGSGHYTTGFGSQSAQGNVLFFVDPSDPHTVRARWGENWDDVLNWQGAGDVCTFPTEVAIADVFVKPVFGEGRFALVADAVDGDGSSRPHFSLSDDSAKYPAVPQPLTFDGVHAPRRVRVFTRARNYWLVTFLRDAEAGETRAHWGTIDWENPPHLREITTATAMQDALCVVGLL